MHPISAIECTSDGSVRTAPRGFAVTDASATLRDSPEAGMRLAYEGGRGTYVWNAGTLRMHFDGLRDDEVTAELRRVRLVSRAREERRVKFEVWRGGDFVAAARFYRSPVVQQAWSCQDRAYAATLDGLFGMSSYNEEGEWVEAARGSFHLVDGGATSGRVYCVGRGTCLAGDTSDAAGRMVDLYSDAHEQVRDAHWTGISATDDGFWVVGGRSIARYHEGSESWELLRLPRDGFAPRCAHAHGQNHAYVGGSDGSVWQYAGNAWRECRARLPGPGPVVAVRAVDLQTVVAIQYPHSVCVSSNAGDTWERHDLHDRDGSLVLTALSVGPDGSFYVGGYEERGSDQCPVYAEMPPAERRWRYADLPLTHGIKDQVVRSIRVGDDGVRWVSASHGLFADNPLREQRGSFDRALSHDPAESAPPASAAALAAGDGSRLTSSSNKEGGAASASSGTPAWVVATAATSVVLIVGLAVYAYNRRGNKK
jgi:hypothetical protein